jgi:NAD(P)-dependent dehydrogenase (short-subunit alcohol dehydrogenase family)
MSAYATSKWGLRGLIRTLRQETRDAPDIHISTLAVYDALVGPLMRHT